MSLWKKTTDNPLSAPTWYARHCYFDGKEQVVEGKVNLNGANTQFEVGDALLYVAPSDSAVLGGLTTMSVYYVKFIEGGVYALAETKDGEALTVTATADASSQMFVKCDTYETTEDGTLNYALIPVTVAEARAKKYGATMNGQGWWRYRRFTKTGSTVATVHAEKLVSFKGDFVTVVPAGGLVDKDADLMLGDVDVASSTGDVNIDGKSVSMTSLNASDVGGYINVTAENGDIEIGGGNLESAAILAVAKSE